MRFLRAPYRRTSMDSLVERCAGLDVHKDTVVACVRYPGPDGGREVDLHTFGTTTRDLLALRDWLDAHDVSRVGRAATGVYWQTRAYAPEDVRDTWLRDARPPTHV